MKNNWFKRLFGLNEGEDEEKEVSSISEQENSSQQRPVYNSQNQEAKVVYDYPKGHFRFPVIPDANSYQKTTETSHSNSNWTINTSVRRKQKAEQQYFTHPQADDEYVPNITRKEFRKEQRGRRQSREREQTNMTVHTTSKKPFKPTEVPSPVYGFSRPKREFIHEEITETVETLEETRLEQEFQTSEATKIEAEIQTSIDDIEIDAEDIETDDVTEIAVKAQTTSDNVEIEPEVEPKVEANDIESINGADVVAIHEESLKEETRKRSGIPFNVLMLKQDKDAFKSKQPEPPKAVPEKGVAKPPLSLLEVPPLEVEEDEEWLQEQSRLLDYAFESFHVGAKVVKATKGPAVTQFEVQPELGVRVNKITNLADDLKLALAAKDIRIEAPIPGKSTVGIEVPNRKSRPVLIREILRSPVFQRDASPLVVALGLDISGQPVVTDLKKMPHGLIAGATGSGKSVCINSIIISLLYKASPHEVKLMLIDPKMVELAPYNNLPHLVSPVITDVKAATAALKWAVEEMERRYEIFAHEGVRDITRFNERVLNENPHGEIMPYLVIIIDELADLMMVSPTDVEDAICRIAQKARACGIHLLLATQRPSVDVITGLIKANVPTRIAFSVSSQVDSRTIIDISGAEKLLGRGDMLFLENGANKPVRIQGNFVKDEEIERVTHFVRKQMKPNYLFVQEELMKQSFDVGIDDELFEEACQFVIEQDGASASGLQRRFRIGYNRAARLVDMMEAQGIVSEAKGSKPREILVTKEQLESRQ
ncbi:MAG TPA: DNA translocase FtsK [Bacillus bacterium]|nr:DNA translocase FtsK [Bacillus sp. (in: firmicutes)]